MTFEFDAWWDSDLLTQTNPYREDSPIYWAWEGWYHGVKAEREACARVCDSIAGAESADCAIAIRARGEK